MLREVRVFWNYSLHSEGFSRALFPLILRTQENAFGQRRFTESWGWGEKTTINKQTNKQKHTQQNKQTTTAIFGMHGTTAENSHFSAQRLNPTAQRVWPHFQPKRKTGRNTGEWWFRRIIRPTLVLQIYRDEVCCFQEKNGRIEIHSSRKLTTNYLQGKIICSLDKWQLWFLRGSKVK